MDFFQFSNIFLAHFRFFRWICDSYGIHVIMVFLELLITKKMPEKNWKNIENWQFYKNITKSYICWKKFEHTAYSLFEPGFYADVKTGFIFDVRQKLWILEWNMWYICSIYWKNRNRTQIYHIFHSRIQSFCRTPKINPVLTSG